MVCGIWSIVKREKHKHVFFNTLIQAYRRIKIEVGSRIIGTLGTVGFKKNGYVKRPCCLFSRNRSEKMRNKRDFLPLIKVNLFIWFLFLSKSSYGTKWGHPGLWILLLHIAITTDFNSSVFSGADLKVINRNMWKCKWEEAIQCQTREVECKSLLI